MNVAATMSIVRTILIAVGSYFVTKGHLTEADLNTIVGGLLALGAAVWGVVEKLRRDPQ